MLGGGNGTEQKAWRAVSEKFKITTHKYLV